MGESSKLDSDVAFSLLSRDVPVVEAIKAELSPGISCFFYPDEQRALIGVGDGLEGFAAAFTYSRLTVVLMREEWGQTDWTRFEKAAIGDRVLSEGTGFLVLCLMERCQPPEWFPRTNLWVDFATESPKSIAGFIEERLRRSPAVPAARITRRSFGRAPVPIERYRHATAMSVGESVPWTRETCDACKEVVQYRPLMKVSLRGGDDWPSTSEQLCPRCAKERGMSGSSRHGLKDEELYARFNPSFGKHLSARASLMAESLRNDARMARMGLADVAVMFAGGEGKLILYGPALPDAGVWVDIGVRKASDAGVVDESSLRRFVREQVESELKKFGGDEA